MQWPVCFSDTVTIGNRDASVGIVTLWTKKEFILNHLHLDQYAIVGQLYSKDEGVNGIIRNLLANKVIRHVILTGIDLNGSGKVLLAFFQNGVDANFSIIGFPDVFVDKEISLASLENLRNHVTLHNLQHIKDFSELSSFIQTFPKLPSYGDPEHFPMAKVAAPEIFPSEKSGFIVRNEFIGPAWLELLSLIQRFGVIKKSDYGVDQRELLNIVTVIEKEDPDIPQFFPYFQFTKEELFAYYPQILDATTIEGVEYSYGQRMRQEQDQIQHIITTLREKPYTRRALAVTWNKKEDMEHEKPPCLIVVEFLIQDNHLFLTCFFRSNDMFHGWPRNSFGLRKLQKYVGGELDLPIGSMTIISSSAHVYQNNWALAETILSTNDSLLKRIGDPRGNIIIRVHDKAIYITQTSPDGKRLDEFSGTDPFALYTALVQKNKISELSHAIYIGTELQKAVIALQKDIPYVQDKELVF